MIYPGATAPGDRAILVKHREHGWIEAQFDADVYVQSIVKHGEELGGFGWSSPAFDNWLYHRDILAWTELPTDDGEAQP